MCEESWWLNLGNATVVCAFKLNEISNEVILRFLAYLIHSSLELLAF